MGQGLSEDFLTGCLVALLWWGKTIFLFSFLYKTTPAAAAHLQVANLCAAPISRNPMTASMVISGYCECRGGLEVQDQELVGLSVSHHFRNARLIGLRFPSSAHAAKPIKPSRLKLMHSRRVK